MMAVHKGSSTGKPANPKAPPPYRELVQKLPRVGLRLVVKRQQRGLQRRLHRSESVRYPNIHSGHVNVRSCLSVAFNS